MPYINIQTGATLAADTRQTIFKALGEVITAIPGKNAGNLMISITDNADMVFAGENTTRCMYVGIQLHKAAGHEEKTKLIEACYKLFTGATGMDANDIYITIQEFENWGALGAWL